MLWPGSHSLGKQGMASRPQLTRPRPPHRSFDNAETYAGGQAEEIMGQALRELVSVAWRSDGLMHSIRLGSRTGRQPLSSARVSAWRCVSCLPT